MSKSSRSFCSVGAFYCLLSVTANGVAAGLPDAERVLQIMVSGNPVGDPQTEPLRNPYEKDPQAVTQGKALYHSMNCDGCHAPKGGGGMGPALSDNVWTYGGSPGEIYLSLLQGRPMGMPAWGHMMPPESLWYLVSYVQSLSGEEGKERPASQQR